MCEDTIEIWGDGQQTRSYLYIDECIEATRKLMDSDFIGPVNIGSEEMVSLSMSWLILLRSIEEKELERHICRWPSRCSWS